MGRLATPERPICLVGPLPPPAGGMANQCAQLAMLLGEEGIAVEVVRTNAPYRPAWAGQVPLFRAFVRFMPYVLALWRAAGRARVFHVLANSGWAWYLFAAPAIRIARWRGVPVIVNYRGGHAREFFGKAGRRVTRTLADAAARVTPSAFLHRVFEAHGLAAVVIPNIVDLTRFVPRKPTDFGDSPHIIVTRNLESIYRIDVALEAFAEVRKQYPGARLTVAGTGPEAARLKTMASRLGIADAVTFAGAIDNRDMPGLYATADCMWNPSAVDNMPIAILESLASGVPVVTTEAGGIPDMVTDEKTALLVPVGDVGALASAAIRLLADRALYERLRNNGLVEGKKYAWPCVRAQWLECYRQVSGMSNAEVVSS